MDQEKCKRDGVCVAECPMRIIEFKDQHSFPTPTGDANELCINCGHCVTVCAHGALSHKNMTPQECPPVRRESFLGPEQVGHFLRARRSIRAYKDRGVDREVIHQLIDMARFAPSGHNVQPVRWLVIYDSGEVRRLAGLVVDWMRSMIEKKASIAKVLHMDRNVSAWEAGVDTVCRGAPHMIVVHALKDEPTAPAACTIALSYLELAAFSFGLGACWAGYFNVAATVWAPMRSALELPEGHISFGAMMLGYPKYRYHRLPIRNEARITWR